MLILDMNVKKCNLEGCEAKHHAKNLCHRHYELMYMKEWREHYKKQYREDNKERMKKYDNQYYLDNREKELKRSKQWQRVNRKRIADWYKQYRKTPNGKASIKAKGHKRRLLESGLTLANVQRVYEDNIKKYGTLTCILCNKPIEFGDDSLEHKTPLSRGGSNDYENLGIAHLGCNHKKYTMTMEEWEVMETV